MSDFDFNKAVGINVDLDEWKQILDERKSSYMEIHDVKKFYFEEFNLEDKNIPILLLVKGSHWAPKNGSGWGSSNEYGYDIAQYGLTNDEIKNLIGHLLDKNIEFRTTEKNMRQWEGDKEIIPPRCQHIVCKNNYDKEKEKELSSILKEAATKKFESKDTVVKHHIHINDYVFEYTSEVKERIGEKNRGTTYYIYLYDKNGKFKKAHHYPAIYG